jgi:hypothetical protein
MNYGAGSVMQQYNEWNFGISYGKALPRAWDVFASGAFGPLAPPVPMGIDAPQDGADRPEPRRMQYPIAWNMPTGQPGSEGLKLVSFANLRAYADMYSVVRACIQVRKEEILGLDWDIIPTDGASRDMRDDPDKHQDFQDRRDEALQFFKRPDPNYHDFSGWMSALLEDVFVVDALTLYLHPPRLRNKGLFGSNLAAIEVLDGTTIRPMLDIRGGTPRPPQVAYQQYLYGIPRVDLMDIILESDIDQMDDPVEEYDADQILYLPYTRRTWTPYGFPGIERAIVPVMTGLRRQQFQLDFFSEGSIPGQFVIPGDDISTPQQIRQLQDTLNAIAGDQAWKHKIIVLPRGSDTKPQKPLSLTDEFDYTVVQMVAMAYNVMPGEIGMSGGGKSASEASSAAGAMAKESSDINRRTSLKPMLQWLENAIFNHILQDICGQDDMQWVWVGLEETADEETQASNMEILIGTGVLSIDEARAQLGMPPWGLPLTSDPVFATATGLTSLGLIAPAAADAQLGAPVADAAANGGTPLTASTPLPAQLPSGANSAPTVIGPASSPASAGTPGAGGRPAASGAKAPSVSAPAAGSSTPLTAGSKKKPRKQSKALEIASLNELDGLRRALKKRRPIDNWNSMFLSEDVVEKVRIVYNMTASVEKAISAGRVLVKSEQRVQRRADTIEGIASNVSTGLADLAAQIDNPDVGMLGFIDGGTQVLQQGYHAAFNAAAQDAVTSYNGINPIGPNDFRFLAEQRAEKQRGYLTGLAQDIKGGTTQAQLNNRINLYASSLVPAYEQGYGLTVLSSPLRGPNPNVGPYDPSDMGDYGALNDLYSADATPNDSGNGMFALSALAALVAGGMLVDDAIGAGQLGNSSDVPPTDDGTVPPAYGITWHVNNEDPCELCADRDGQVYTLDSLPCWPGDGGFGEFCDGAANCRCTLEYGDAAGTITADNPFSDISNQFYPERQAQEASDDQRSIDARNADIASVADISPGAADRMAARDAQFGTPGTRFAPGGNLAAAEVPSLLKASDIEDLVYGYLAKQYTKDSIAWVKDATWTYDPEVDVSSLVLARPTLETNDEKVAAIKDKIGNGGGIKPLVIVKTLQGNEVVDGNHRVNALREMGIHTAAAYVGAGNDHLGQYAVAMQHEDAQKLYKALDPSMLTTLQIGDLVYDDDVIVFSTTRPNATVVAVVKNALSNEFTPGQEMLVTDITDNEVILEIQ